MAGGRRRSAPRSSHRYPRVARVNQVLREVVGDELERLTARDERLDLLTVTSVDCDADFRTATVYFSSLDETEADALSDARVRLQAAVAREARLKWTPLLRFAADPAVSHGLRVEEILRSLPAPVDHPGSEASPEPHLPTYESLDPEADPGLGGAVSSPEQ